MRARAVMFAAAMLAASDAVAQTNPGDVVEQPPLCYTGSNPDQCECIIRYNLMRADYTVVTLSLTRSLSYPQTVPTWQIQSLPSGARTEFLADADILSAWNDCVSHWAAVSTLITKDGAQTQISPSGNWQVLWLSTEGVRALPGNPAGSDGVGAWVPQITVSGDDSQFWISGSTIYLAYDPNLTDAGGIPHDYTWTANIISSTELSIRASLSHEFGHSLGFDDFSGPTPTRSVMYAVLSDPNHKTYADDSNCEISGASQAYMDASVDALVDGFRVENDPAGVRVSWHASQEYGLLGYLVEQAPSRSGPFTVVGNVAPTADRNYAFLDSQHTSGVWRMRQLTTAGDTLMDSADTISVVPPAGTANLKPQTLDPTEIDSLRAVQSGLFPDAIQPIGPEFSDWICIVPDAWAASAQPLANFWNAHGHQAWVTKLSEAGGTAGIHSFLANLPQYGHLRYVLLMGDANDYDYWSNNALWINGWVRPTWPTQGQYNFIPMGEYVVDTRAPGTPTSIGGWTPYWSSDWAYVDFNGDHMPDVDIGRVTARSANDVTLFVQKVLNVMAMPTSGVPLNHIGIWTYARDKRYASGAIAAQVGLGVRAAIPSNRVADVLWDDDTSLMTQDQRESLARSAMEAGRGLIAVNGAASSEANWSDWWVQHEFSWPLRTAPNWLVLPFLVGAACGIAAADLTEDPWPAGTSGAYSTQPMIEQALTDPTQGPWGCFGPTHGGPQQGHEALERAFLDQLFVFNASTAGDAARQAVRSVMTQYPQYADLARSYILLGDPLVPLRTTVPAPTVAISGPTVLDKGVPGTFTATATGGDGTRTFSWYRRSDPTASWSYMGAGITNSELMGVGDFELRCDVASAGMTASTQLCVVYSGSPLAISASMLGPTSAACGTSGTWSVYAAGGRICREYNYAWQLSPNGGASWGPVVGTGASFTLTVTGYFMLQVTVSGGDSPPAIVSQSITATGCGGGDGGGCPFLDTHTATGWITENSILGRSASGAAMVDYYRLKATPIERAGTYELRIRENERERTTLHEVRLLAVDHPPDVQVLGGAEGIVAGRFVPAARVVRADGSDVTALVTGPKAPGLYGQPGDVLIATPPQVPPAPTEGSIKRRSIFTAAVIIKSDAGWAGGPGVVDLDRRVLEGSGLRFESPAASGWSVLDRRYPREYFDETTVEAPEGTPVRIEFVGHHGLRAPGWLVPTGASITVSETALRSATHTRLGDVQDRVSGRHGAPIALESGDTLALSFDVQPPTPGMARDFFLVTRGWYTTPAGAELGGTAALPPWFALHQNEPNPFSRTTLIRFDLPTPGHVRISVYDLQGRLLRTLANESFEAGYRSVVWDQRDASGRSVRPGIYLYRMETAGFRQTRKMTVLP